MQWLAISWMLITGLAPVQDGSLIGYKGDGSAIVRVFDEETYFATAEVKADVLSHAKLWGSVETFLGTTPGPLFSPFRVDYSLGVALYSEGLELGVSQKYSQGLNPPLGISSWYPDVGTTFYLKFSGNVF